jgi:CRP-like cAMP-binding protein
MRRFLVGQRKRRIPIGRPSSLIGIAGEAPLSDDDKRLLDEVVAQSRQVKGKTDLIREGETPDDVHLILEGFACRYKITPDGKRQIVAYLVPGDFCDLHTFILKRMDHSIATLSPCRVVDMPRAHVLETWNGD